MITCLQSSHRSLHSHRLFVYGRGGQGHFSEPWTWNIWMELFTSSVPNRRDGLTTGSLAPWWRELRLLAMDDGQTLGQLVNSQCGPAQLFQSLPGTRHHGPVTLLKKEKLFSLSNCLVTWYYWIYLVKCKHLCNIWKPFKQAILIQDCLFVQGWSISRSLSVRGNWFYLLIAFNYGYLHITSLHIHFSSSLFSYFIIIIFVTTV